MKLSRDINGNKILKLTSKDLEGRRGYNIQTNGNLPLTHRMCKDSLDKKVVMEEVLVYLAIISRKFT